MTKSMIILLDKVFCRRNMMRFFLIYFLVIYWVFYLDKIGLRYIMDRRNLELCLVLITAIIQMFDYIRKLKYETEILYETNQKLTLANTKTKEAMSSLIELYQAVQLLTSKIDRQSVLNFIIQYTKELAKTDQVCYYSLSERIPGMMTQARDFPSLLLKSIENAVLEQMSELMDSEGPVEVNCNGSVFLFVPVRSIHELFGILCVEKITAEYSEYFDSNELLRVFAKLCATELEKFDLEVFKDRLLISEEQNRIANEIHDGVLQRLFSISCGLFSLSKRLLNIEHSQINEELLFIRHSVDGAMRELREKVYGMSWKKNCESTFEVSLQNYLAELKRLHGVELNFSLTGNQELMTLAQKKALYRVLCEGLSNAIRHGKAQKLDVTLNISPRGTQLNITDDGSGFQMNHEAVIKGLGLRNIQLLVDSLEGTVNFSSKIDGGTKIDVFLPNRSSKGLKEEII